jgi:transmembrane sensor
MNTPLRESDAARIGRRVQANWESTDVERALAATHARIALRRQRLAIGATGLALSLAAAVLFAVLYRPSLATPQIAPSGSVAALAPAASPVTFFADGSTARVLQGGQIVVQTATETRIETVLETGAAEYSVAPKPARAFIVHAGRVTVEVIGTQFLVENEGERVRVAVTRGKVKVTSGDERVELVPGESRWFARNENDPGKSPEGDDPGKSPEWEAPAAPADAEAGRVAAGPSQRERFVDLARRGDYGNAYQVLARSPSAVGSNAEDLMLAADAARLSNHPVEALVYLRRVTREHPRDTRAPLSAFTQGRILLSQLGRPTEAADAFEQARRLAPTGPLASLALARQIEALNRAGQTERARALAAE